MRLLISVFAASALIFAGCGPAGSGNKRKKDAGVSDFGGFVPNTPSGGGSGATGDTAAADTTGADGGAADSGEGVGDGSAVTGGTGVDSGTGGDSGAGDTGGTPGGGDTGGVSGSGDTGSTGGSGSGDTTGGSTGATTGGNTGGTGSGIGNPCTDAADCEGNTCIPVGDGYCSVSGCDSAGCPAGSTCWEFPDVGFYCLQDCQSNADCPSNLVCDTDKTCWPGETVDPGPTGDGGVGDACETDSDCKDPGATCYPYLFNGEPTGFVNGYCIIFTCSTNSCPAGATCMEVTEDGGTACVSNCSANTNCRATEGYSCFEPGICFPGCSGAGVSCPNGYQCDAEKNSCLPACTATSCTGGKVCNQASGYCEAPPCTAGSCGAGYICSATSGKCIPDLSNGPGAGPGPVCNNLPPKDCTGTNAYCGQIMQFDPADGTGYTNYPLNGETWENQYRSFARRDMIMLVKWASAYVDCKAVSWGGGNGFPLGLGDMSEADGAIPGTSIGSPGHPANTHEDGYDMDIAYYQNAGANNYLKAVCDHTSNGQDAYHCVSEPYLMDIWRTSLFLGALFSSDRTRVIGVDGKVGTSVSQALQVLCAEGWLPAASCVPANQNLACEIEGEPEPGNICWKENGAFWFNFHHHHLHLSLWGLAGKPGAPQQNSKSLTSDGSDPIFSPNPKIKGHGAVDTYFIDLPVALPLY